MEVKTWKERKAEKKIAEAKVAEEKAAEEEKALAEAEEEKKNIPTDCRLCAHYPLQNAVATTGLSPELTAVTHGFTRTFCGQAPANGLDCRNKKFTPIAK